MKFKAILISAVCAAVLAALFGFHSITTPPAGKQSAAVSKTPLLSRPSDGGLAAFEAAEPAPIPTRNPTAAAQVSQASAEETNNLLGIRPEHLDDAMKLADEMAANMERYRATMEDTAYSDRPLNAENPSGKIALRLGLDEAASKKMRDVISAHLSNQIKLRIDAGRKRMEREANFLAEDRDGFVNYLALQSMAARGETLSAKQDAFYQGIRGTLDPESEAGEPSGITNWHENPEIVDAVNRLLPEQQQAELKVYLEEQRRRDGETQAMHVYMRSTMIAERLGLDDEDRSALHRYLQDNPKASRSDIAGIMAPELRALLPEGL